MIIICQKCGTGTPQEHGKFCGKCGRLNVKTHIKGRYCSQCKKEWESERYKYCTHCGNGAWFYEEVVTRTGKSYRATG